MRLSMHSEIAVESMTLRPRFRISRYVMLVKRVAFGSFMGSPV